MKKGLLIYQHKERTDFNIGDYIQSLAACQYFNNEIDIYLNRGELDTYHGEKVKLIMNGWFLHETENWPPSIDVIPLFISFHMNSIARNKLLGENSINYLKQWQPIGCRDKLTAKLLKDKGIDSYFSGCLTTTLGLKYKTEIRTNDIFFVDPHINFNKDIFSILKYISVLVRNIAVIRTICNSLYNKINTISLIKASAFYNDYAKVFESSLLEQAIYIKHMAKILDFENEVDKFIHAKELISKYARAKFVVTSRIHCALPCLGVETPVIYIENTNQQETSHCRLDGLRDLLNIISYDRKGSMKILFTKLNKKIGADFNFKNKMNYVRYRDQMIRKCQIFIESVK